MGRLKKDALDIVLKTEMTDADRAAIVEQVKPAAPATPAAPQKGTFVKGDAQHVTGKKGFRIIGCIHQSADLTSEIIGYVLFNDKKGTFTQYSTTQVINILETYEFVNAEIDESKHGNARIHITDCAKLKLMQFDNFMNAINNTVYVVARTTETVKIGGNSKDQTVFQIVNRNLQVTALPEDKLMTAVKSDKATIANLRVDERYFAAKDLESLPTYEREVKYVVEKQEETATPAKNTKLKFENHARFVDNVVEFLHNCYCVDTFKTVGAGNTVQTTYLGIGAVNDIKRGIEKLSTNPKKLTAVMFEEVLPLYIARYRQELTKYLQDIKLTCNSLMSNSDTLITAGNSPSISIDINDMYGHKVINGFSYKGPRMNGIEILTHRNGKHFLHIVMVFAARTGLLNSIKADKLLHIFAPKKQPFMLLTLSKTRNGLNFVSSYRLNRIYKEHTEEEIGIPRKHFNAFFGRLPALHISKLDELGRLVSCGIARVEMPNPTEYNSNSTKACLVLWPNYISPNETADMVACGGLSDEDKKYAAIMVKHISTEYYHWSYAKDSEKAYMANRILAMTAALSEYIMCNGGNISIKLYSAFIRPLPSTIKENAIIAGNIETLHKWFNIKTEQYAKKNKPLAFPNTYEKNATILKLYIKTGGLAIPLRLNKKVGKIIPNSILKTYDAAANFNAFGESYISKDSAFARKVTAAVMESPRPSMLSGNRYFTYTIAARIQAYMQVFYGEDVLNTKKKSAMNPPVPKSERCTNLPTANSSVNYRIYSSYRHPQSETIIRSKSGGYRTVAATQLYMLRPYYDTFGARSVGEWVGDSFRRVRIPAMTTLYNGSLDSAIKSPSTTRTHHMW